MAIPAGYGAGRNPGTAMGALGLVFGLLAVVVALSSSADAGSRHAFVRKGDIAPGAVTAKALAKGAVTSRKLASGAVNSRALAKGAVTTGILDKGAVNAAALANNAVTAVAIAPGSVYGGALGTLTTRTVQIADLDTVAENGTWTASNTEAVTCAPGERLISGGFVFTNPGNREVAFPPSAALYQRRHPGGDRALHEQLWWQRRGRGRGSMPELAWGCRREA